jgi:hypothetical protein
VRYGPELTFALDTSPAEPELIFRYGPVRQRVDPEAVHDVLEREVSRGAYISHWLRGGCVAQGPIELGQRIERVGRKEDGCRRVGEL